MAELAIRRVILIVIEVYLLPGNRRMTDGTLTAEMGIGNLLEVTVAAQIRCPCVLGIGMAGQTIQFRMFTF